MRNFILIFCSVLLFSCASKNKRVFGDPNQVKVKKEGRKIYGTVTQKYFTLSDKGSQLDLVKKPKLSLKVDREYYIISVSGSEVNIQDLEVLVGQKIEVRGKLIGEGFVGELAINEKKSNSEVNIEAEIGSIVIYEILEIDK